jgi:hypothetical protein
MAADVRAHGRPLPHGVAALDAVFPSYRGYLIGGGDVAIVASPLGPLAEPDWTFLDRRRFRAVTAGAPAFRAEHMESLLLFDETTLRPLLSRGVRPNSDFRPVLDLRAERARFEQRVGRGRPEPRHQQRGPTRASCAGHDRTAPLPPRALLRARPAVLWGRGAWLREARATRGRCRAHRTFPPGRTRS